MKKILIILIGIFCCRGSSAQNKDVETLKKLNADWIAFYVTKDSATMSGIFADDLVLTNPGGKAMSKFFFKWPYGTRPAISFNKS